MPASAGHGRSTPPTKTKTKGKGSPLPQHALGNDPIANHINNYHNSDPIARLFMTRSINL